MSKYIPIQKHREMYKKYHRFDMIYRILIFFGIIVFIVFTVALIGAFIEWV